MKLVPTLVADTLRIKHAREDVLNLSGFPVVSLEETSAGTAAEQSQET